MTTIKRSEYLKADLLHSIEYEPAQNDRPVAIYRYDGFHMIWPAADIPNWVLALYYFALERSNPEDITND